MFVQNEKEWSIMQMSACFISQMPTLFVIACCLVMLSSMFGEHFDFHLYSSLGVVIMELDSSIVRSHCDMSDRVLKA